MLIKVTNISTISQLCENEKIMSADGKLNEDE